MLMCIDPCLYPNVFDKNITSRTILKYLDDFNWTSLILILKIFTARDSRLEIPRSQIQAQEELGAKVRRYTEIVNQRERQGEKRDGQEKRKYKKSKSLQVFFLFPTEKKEKSLKLYSYCSSIPSPEEQNIRRRRRTTLFSIFEQDLCVVSLLLHS